MADSVLTYVIHSMGMQVACPGKDMERIREVLGSIHENQRAELDAVLYHVAQGARAERHLHLDDSLGSVVIDAAVNVAIQRRSCERANNA